MNFVVSTHQIFE